MRHFVLVTRLEGPAPEKSRYDLQMRWILLASLCFPFVAGAVDGPVCGPDQTLDYGHRVCASTGMSCKPGPCCRGLKCIDDTCQKPEPKEEPKKKE